MRIVGGTCSQDNATCTCTLYKRKKPSLTKNCKQIASIKGFGATESMNVLQAVKVAVVCLFTTEDTETSDTAVQQLIVVRYVYESNL